MNATSEFPQAVLWDMDGTIIDSEPLWLRTELAMLERFGLSMPEGTEERLVGSGLRAAAALFQEIGVPLSIPAIIADWTTGVIAGLRETGPQWRPGALELLSALPRAGIPCALVTMAVRPIADAVIELLPESTFAYTVAGDEVRAEKPDPAPYQQAAAALGVDIDACIVFEDSPTGLASASAAGAVAIGIPNLVVLDDAPADALLDTLAGQTPESVGTLFRAHHASARRTPPPSNDRTGRSR